MSSPREYILQTFLQAFNGLSSICNIREAMLFLNWINDGLRRWRGGRFRLIITCLSLAMFESRTRLGYAGESRKTCTHAMFNGRFRSLFQKQITPLSFFHCTILLFILLAGILRLKMNLCRVKQTVGILQNPIVSAY